MVVQVAQALPEDQGAVLVIAALQQVVQQEHQDKDLLAAITLALLRTHPAAAGVHLRLA